MKLLSCTNTRVATHQESVEGVGERQEALAARLKSHILIFLILTFDIVMKPKVLTVLTVLGTRFGSLDKSHNF